MLKVNRIFGSSQIVNPSGTSFRASVPSRAVCQNSAVSKPTSEGITYLQKRLIAVRDKALDINSAACRFFGVDSFKNLFTQLENSVKLARLKCSENGILLKIPGEDLLCIDDEKSVENVWNCLWNESCGKEFEKLKSKPARFTIYSRKFGHEIFDGAHTMGLVFDDKSKTLYCLDSLSNKNPLIKLYQDVLTNKVFNSPNGEIKKIIFSNKPQQSMNEYTCNHWAIANIEAVQKARKAGEIIDTTEKLNSILPDDINQILREHHGFILSRSQK